MRTPLLLAAIALVIGAVGTFRAGAKRAFISATVMMLMFFQAARVAMVTFDPYFSSRPIADAIQRSPEGKLIADKHYYAYSSVFFYTNRTGLLLNGRILNLSYGSYAPGAPDVFIDDTQLKELWSKPERYYLVAGHAALPRLEGVLGRARMNVVVESGGKYLFTNSPLPGSTLLAGDASASSRWEASLQPINEKLEDRECHSVFPSPASGSSETAFRPQTRYILCSRDLSISNGAEQDSDPQLATRLRPLGFRVGSPSDRLAKALNQRHSLPVEDVVARVCGTSKRGTSVLDASRQCTSPEEDA